MCLHTILQHPSDPGRIFVAISAAGVFRTDDAGELWHEVRGNLPSDFGFPIDVHAHEPDTYRWAGVRIGRRWGQLGHPSSETFRPCCLWKSRPCDDQSCAAGASADARARRRRSAAVRPGQAMQRSVLDVLESRYPMLRGTIRDYTSGQRRAFCPVDGSRSQLIPPGPGTEVEMVTARPSSSSARRAAQRFAASRRRHRHSAAPGDRITMLRLHSSTLGDRWLGSATTKPRHAASPGRVVCAGQMGAAWAARTERDVPSSHCSRQAYAAGATTTATARTVGTTVPDTSCRSRVGSCRSRCSRTGTTRSS